MKSLPIWALLTGLAQPAWALENRLTDWNIGSWNPESQAACGVSLTKFGLLASVAHQDDRVFQILYRGIALNKLSESTAPETNAAAWAAQVSTRDAALHPMLSTCTDLFNTAEADRLIPGSIKDYAVQEANDILQEK